MSHFIDGVRLRMLGHTLDRLLPIVNLRGLSLERGDLNVGWSFR
ncbi:MAG TPA: hypothetical protein VFA85_10140 [Terriglobales bacterium]|nr:hypothetical protein [Terriglobales bacterium]